MFPYDAITISDNLTASGTTVTLLDSSDFSQGYTVLNVHLTSNMISSNQTVIASCGSNSLAFLSNRMATNVPAIRVNEYWGQFVCNFDLDINTTGGSQDIYYNVTYLPYDIHASTSPKILYYHDFLFPIIVIIFLLAFVPLGLFLSPFKKYK